MMNSIHLDTLGGISGDMFAAAFLDQKPQLMIGIREAVGKLKLGEGVLIETKPHSDGILNGTRFVVQDATSESPFHTPWKVIRDRIQSAGLEQGICENALGIFSLLAEAEAEVHGIERDEVIFHEVGAVDSMIDVLAAAVILDAHPSFEWFLGSLPLGRGEVQTAHGKLPLPAPAVVELLKGFDFDDDGETGERVTPTGAAIIGFLAETRGLSQKPEKGKKTLLASGLGFGSRKLKTKSNLLRVLLFGTSETVPEEDQISVLRFEVDDQTPEDLAEALEHLRNSDGVLDVVQWPVYGKKGRIAFSVQILVRTEASESVIEKIFVETTTLGVRYREESRKILERSEVEVEGSRVKLAQRPSGVTAKMEMDDLKEVQGNENRTELRNKIEKIALKGGEENQGQ